jgi:hypothetical protein
VPTIHTVYQKLVESDWLDVKKDNIDKHPMIAYQKEGRKQEPG